MECDFQGMGQFFPGKVRIVGEDGRCDIEYDDGDEERGVSSHRIRPLSKTMAAAASAPAAQEHEQEKAPAVEEPQVAARTSVMDMNLKEETQTVRNTKSEKYLTY